MANATGLLRNICRWPAACGTPGRTMRLSAIRRQVSSLIRKKCIHWTMKVNSSLLKDR
ncbi:hypothetical protein D3C75_1333190 [compost metagenome]